MGKEEVNFNLENIMYGSALCGPCFVHCVFWKYYCNISSSYQYIIWFDSKINVLAISHAIGLCCNTNMLTRETSCWRVFKYYRRLTLIIFTDFIYGLMKKMCFFSDRYGFVKEVMEKYKVSTAALNRDPVTRQAYWSNDALPYKKKINYYFMKHILENPNKLRNWFVCFKYVSDRTTGI